MSLSSSPNSSSIPDPKNRADAVQESIPSGESDTRSTRIIQRPQSQHGADKFEPLPSDWQYETAVDKVEAIIQDIEDGELELADIFEQFSIAVQELHACESFLQHHRHQVDLLVETLGNVPQD